MSPTTLTCKKRDGKSVPFDPTKIHAALVKCFTALNPTEFSSGVPTRFKYALEAVTGSVVHTAMAPGNPAVVTVEHLQRLVIRELWTRDMYDAAEHYQNYRETHRKKRDLETSLVFDRRVAFKPFDYPDTVKFKDAIKRSMWFVEHIDFTNDIQAFHTELLPHEREAAARGILAISQIEVNLKEFWGRLGSRLPRPEFAQVGYVFAESEVRHGDAYSALLDHLSLADAFANVTKVPAIQARIDYLARAMRTGADGSDRSYAKTLAVFALLVENVSLFGQFALLKSYAKHRGALANVDNVVQATQREELIHALFGIWLVNQIRSERPEWFDQAFYDDLAVTCKNAYKAEGAILDWILAEGRPNFISRIAIDEFLKYQINYGITAIGGPPVFDVDTGILSELSWFTEEIHATVDGDFFFKAQTTYDSGTVAITGSNLF